MKQRFTNLDIKCIATDLQRLHDYRCQNIFELNSNRTYLFKFSRQSEKEFLIADNGNRIHLTQHLIPGRKDHGNQHLSPFMHKLKKYLKGRRLVSVSQLKNDRVLILTFECPITVNKTVVDEHDVNDQEDHQIVDDDDTLEDSQKDDDDVSEKKRNIEWTQLFLIFEFFASGNIVLTKKDWTILNVLRVPEDTEKYHYNINDIYDISHCQSFPSLTDTALNESIFQANPKDSLKKIIASLPGVGTIAAEHWLYLCGQDMVTKRKSECSQEDISQLADFIPQMNLLLYKSPTKQLGYVIYELADQTSDQKLEVAANHSTSLKYMEYQPFLFCQYRMKHNEKLHYLEFPSFSEAVDEYYNKLESQKQSQKIHQAESQASKKLLSIQSELDSRIKSLRSQQMLSKAKAQIIESNKELVDEAITVTQLALANGMTWEAFGNLVKSEIKKGNRVAAIIRELKLNVGVINLELNQTTPTMLEGDESGSTKTPANYTNKNYSFSSNSANPEKNVMDVDIDIFLNSYGNIQKYYEEARAFAAKETKTLSSSKKAIKSAKSSIFQELNSSLADRHISSLSLDEQGNIPKIRKPFWFEKFLWCISSENYIIIGGHHRQQNEILVKKYLQKDDVYVHADISGAASIIIKNKSLLSKNVPATAGKENLEKKDHHTESSLEEGTNSNSNPIPPLTLMQAGQMSLIFSKAWESKIVTSAYWVKAAQVSKTPQSGEYLVSGSFVIRGKKNFLPLSQLVYGFGLLWKITEESALANHANERCVKSWAEEVEIDDDAKRPTSFSSPKNLERMSQERNESTGTSFNPRERNKLKLYDISSFITSQYASQDQNENESDTSIESLSDDANIGQQAEVIPSHRHASTKAKYVPKPAPEPKKSGQVRGKKGKLKKIKAKYKDQDEEDRKLRMRLLGCKLDNSRDDQKMSGARTKLEKRRQEFSSVKEDNAFSQKVETVQDQKILQSTHLMEQSLEKEDTYKYPEMEKIDNTDDGNIGSQRTEEDDESILRTLTGNPHPSDTILYAIPVSAPYTTLQSYKYKVKLIPGTQKKGKACKTSQSIFLANSEMTPREKSCIKNLSMDEMILVMPQNCKVVPPSSSGQKNTRKG